jgi:hypothetical protein
MTSGKLDMNAEWLAQALTDQCHLEAKATRDELTSGLLRFTSRCLPIIRNHADELFASRQFLKHPTNGGPLARVRQDLKISLQNLCRDVGV